LVTIILTCQLELPGVSSLKEKRRILKSLVTRLRNSFNISVSEVGDNDIWRRAILGVALVSNDNNFGHQVMAKVIGKIESESEIVVADYQTESY